MHLSASLANLGALCSSSCSFWAKFLLDKRVLYFDARQLWRYPGIVADAKELCSMIGASIKFVRVLMVLATPSRAAKAEIFSLDQRTLCDRSELWVVAATLREGAEGLSNTEDAGAHGSHASRRTPTTTIARFGICPERRDIGRDCYI